MLETVNGIERFTRRPGAGGEGGGAFYILRCRRCPNKFEHKARKYSGPPPNLEDEVLPEAKKAGWDVLHGARRATCPDCREMAARLKAKREEKIMVTKPAPVVPAALLAPSTPAAPRAEPPRTMDFEDRRVILMKLNEVYDSPSTGYGRGWSDKRVAEVLGAPRAWVAELREQNFGPARDNDDVREFLTEARNALAAAKDLTEQTTKCEAEHVVLRRMIDDLKGRLNRLERQSADLQKAVG
ncbi:MAG: hypothetical protein DI549_10880 [Ancylobacter novellus]|uniref:Uncharacterized protein n=1 Tax=Ancylobacter novellus TaxID=921 RepID=A0A2W5R701_ANCNO|nr:MAG: hypothetical protein DI549_10880 [Ancylobacter novellus]